MSGQAEEILGTVTFDLNQLDIGATKCFHEQLRDFNDMKVQGSLTCKLTLKGVEQT